VHRLTTFDASASNAGGAAEEVKSTELQPELIEDYLAREGRTAANLLSAFHASGRTNYLVEAVLQFPRDPRIQFTVLSRNVFPEERRKWLDLFKSSSPDNALPNYLSAREYLRNGDDESGLRELEAARKKQRFEDFSAEARANEESLQVVAGKTPLDARLSSRGWAKDLLGTLNDLKGISHDLSRIQKQFVSTGRAQEGSQLIEAGLVLVDRIAPVEGARYTMNQLIAWSMEAVFLRGLEPLQSFDFLGGKTPQARLDEITAERDSLKALTDLAKRRMPEMTEPEKLNFLERQRTEGEVEALRWLGRQ
jgi:hypothetical protein